MKKFILSLFVLTFAATAVAQESRRTLSFDVGGELGFAIGDLSKYQSVLIGGSAQVEYSFSEKLAGVGHIGLLTFFGNNDNHTRFIPIRVGVKYYLLNRLHAGGQIGVAFTEVERAAVKTTPTAFNFSPQVGFQFGPKWDVTGKLDFYAYDGGTQAALGVRLSYILGGR